MKKYYVKRIGFGQVTYKRYKCIEGWACNKEMCWRFSRQGAKKIVERLINYYQNHEDYLFEMEEAI